MNLTRQLSTTLSWQQSSSSLSSLRLLPSTVEESSVVVVDVVVTTGTVGYPLCAVIIVHKSSSDSQGKSIRSVVLSICWQNFQRKSDNRDAERDKIKASLLKHLTFFYQLLIVCSTTTCWRNNGSSRMSRETQSIELF